MIFSGKFLIDPKKFIQFTFIIKRRDKKFFITTRILSELRFLASTLQAQDQPNNDWLWL